MKQLFVIILTAISLSASGQSSRYVTGLEGGAGLAGLRGNAMVDDHDLRMGYTGGLFVQYNFKRLISVRTGCYYERKGSSFNLNFVDINGNPLGRVNGKENFDFLTVPLLFRLNFGQKIQCFVNAGPYAGFLIKQTEYTEAFQTIPEITSDRTSNFEKTEIGLSLGAGLNYSLNEKYLLSLEVRNNLGLNNISAVPILNDNAIKTNSVNLLVGFNYTFGKRGE